MTKKYRSEINQTSISGITPEEVKALKLLAERVGASSMADLIRRLARQASNPGLEQVLIEVISEDRRQAARRGPEGEDNAKTSN